MSKSHKKHGGMTDRGATRPMTMDLMGESKDEGHEGKGPGEGDQDHPKMHQPDEQMRMKMLQEHHRKTLWIYWTLILLGIWTLLAPISFGYGTALVTPAGGRDVWLEIGARVAIFTWSDILSGLLLVVFGWRALKPNRPYSLWAACFVGIWLSGAPILFWAPSAAIYLNDTMVGALVIALTILIPGMPNMIHYMKMGPEKPPGWSYNPSSWPQRWIMIALGFAGWVVSRYLAVFQLGYIDAAWDPFFGEGSRKVLTSSMSESLPISDGALGAFAYTFEFLMGWMGSPARWRTMPWMVTFFGILVIPLGLVHIFLVASQPIVVGHWCTMCLLAAAIMLPMIPLEVDEVVAMAQFLKRAKRQGQSLWEAFWKGGIVEGAQPEETQPPIHALHDHPWKVLKASVRGMSVPWSLAVSTLLGIWLMATPGLLGTQKPMADIEHGAGALVIVVSVISMGEVLRIGRYLNILLGLALATFPWILTGETLTAAAIDTAVGALLMVLALPRGPKKERYAGWDQFVR